MFGSVVLFPLRFGVRAVELALRGAAEALERLAELAAAHVDHPPDPGARE